ncbi:MAG TPA: hypothetical protein VIH62_06685, partial [Xanthobacteraceae bacterium]
MDIVVSGKFDFTPAPVSKAPQPAASPNDRSLRALCQCGLDHSIFPPGRDGRGKYFHFAIGLAVLYRRVGPSGRFPPPWPHGRGLGEADMTSMLARLLAVLLAALWLA